MGFEQDISQLGVFTEPQRRRVFERLQADGPCTVTALVDTLGVGRTLVAFHLGKLLESGFVEGIGPDATTGGPGRPAQRYRVSKQEVVASVPDRRYDLLAGVLLDSIADFRPDDTAHTSALRAARRRGAELGRQLASGRLPRTATARFARLERLLSTLGYAPRRQGDELFVRNCPFDTFRATNTEQVCSLNLSLSDGYLEGLGLDRDLQADLRPDPDSCCVAFRQSG
ncbi:MAG: helix-turn-helix domain-containing protein [Mycobacteriales bacterium]